jgi:hypothetical protein
MIKVSLNNPSREAYYSNPVKNIGCRRQSFGARKELATARLIIPPKNNAIAGVKEWNIIASVWRNIVFIAAGHLRSSVLQYLAGKLSTPLLSIPSLHPAPEISL